MSFTITNAKTLADSWTEEVIDSSKALIWGNEFIQSEVGSRTFQESTAELVATKDTWYDLPVPTVATEEVPAVAGFVYAILVSSGNCSNYKHYIIQNRKIKFADTDTYTLTYAGYPSALPSASDTVPLHDAFLYPMAKFFLFKHYSFEYDDSDMQSAAERYRAEYLIGIKKAYDEIEMDSENESFSVRAVW